MDDAAQTPPGDGERREPLRGEVEVDDTWIGGEQAGLWGEPTTEGQAGGSGPGRRRKAWPSFRPGSHECDSGLQGCHDQVVPNPKRCLGFHDLYRGSQEFLWSVGGRFKHLVRNQPLRSEMRKGAKSAVPLADRAIGNLQQWLIGTYHGVSKDQLQVYLDEFVFRHNRRKTPAAAFQTLLGLGTGRRSTMYEQIRGAKDLIPNPLGFAEATR
jgi:hypothetical protein